MKDIDRWWDLNNPYAVRDDELRRMGFRTYRAYLKSGLWSEIRRRAIARAGGRCERCRKSNRLQVHHRAYDAATLAGRSIESLTVLCANCHRRAEKPRARRSAVDRFYGAVKDGAPRLVKKTSWRKKRAAGKARAVDDPVRWHRMAKADEKASARKRERRRLKRAAAVRALEADARYRYLIESESA